MATNPNPVSAPPGGPRLFRFPKTNFMKTLAATILLVVTYPEAYPSVAPTLDLSSPPNSPKHALFDLSASKPALLSLLPPLIHDSLGTAMIFTLIQAVKDGAEALVGERIAAAERVVDDRRRQEEAVEEAKFMGEKVTRESFTAWRERFRASMKEEEEERRRAREEKEGAGPGKKGGAGSGGAEEKLTGRELWERGLVGKGEEDLGEDEVGAMVVGGMEGLKVGEK